MGETVTIQKNWQELIRPNKLQVQPGSDPTRFATIVAEPLERGFGQTLGNALRRILLSSLQGAAVQSVHIDGVLHEFSSIAGVREDVTDIVLNIKDISIKMQGEGPKRMVVKKSGPGVVTAGDIQTVGDVVVLNPDLQICTLDEGAEIRMEFTVATGKGYVPAERNRPEDAPIGLIPVDSLYSPVRKVSYKVENTREGQILDYDKLTMTIETNGALTPDDSVAYAARILQDQLNVFVNFEEPAQGSRPGDHPGPRLQPGLPQEGGRARAVGALGQLLEERQHRLHRRPRAEERSGNAPHSELRPQVSERDQGSAGPDGSAPRHGSAGLAAGEHRRARQALRGSLLIRTTTG
ncbi:DNA-directed RNA polymerase alpha subunit [Bradyrhizobium sp. GM5.1]